MKAFLTDRGSAGTAFEQAPVPMLTVDQGGIVRQVNLAAASLGVPGADSPMPLHPGQPLDWSEEGGEGPGDEGRPSGSLRPIHEAVMNTFRTGRPEQRLLVCQLARSRSQREEVAFLVSTTLLGAAEDARVLVCLEDLREQRAVEVESGAGGVSFQQIVEQSEIGMVVADGTGMVRFANAAAVRLLGRAASELIGSSFGFPAELGAFRETELTDERGQKRVVEMRTVVGDWGQGAFFLISLLDVTRRKAVEAALRESQERLSLVIEGSDDGVWDWNVLTNEVCFSPRWKCMLGYAEHEIANNFQAWEELLHPNDRERALATLRDYLEGRSPNYELEHRLRHKDGSYRWILARGVACRDSDGRPVRMAGSHVDLTARKQAEQSLHRALLDLEVSHAELKSTQMQLIQAEKLDSVGKLAAGVAHEVKNPLQTLLMGLGYLQRQCTEDDPNLAVIFREMLEAVARADAIVRSLLELAGDRALSLVEEDLNAVVQEALHLVNYSFNTARVRVVHRLAPDLPRLMLDRAKMEQVFINIFNNAAQAMEGGGVLTVTTSVMQSPAGSAETSSAKTSNRCRVVAEVQDTGPGIPEEHLAKLFTPFFTTKPKGIGTGLGLQVSKSIVEMHGGTIEVRNGGTGGACVTIVMGSEGGLLAPEA